MQKFILLPVLLFANVCFAQFTDNFSDGDFISAPNWAGDDAKFIVSSGQLKLSAPAIAGTAYLSTGSNAVQDATWEFFVKLEFNPSSANYVRVYLVSDQADLTGLLNGYYILIGDTPREISLYRQTGTTRQKIIDGADNRVNMSLVQAKVKITRDANGLWSLSSDVGLTGSYTNEGSAVESTHFVSNYAGVYCVYTLSNAAKIYFDDFVVTGVPVPDTTPPALQTIEVLSATELTLHFSEELDPVSATVSQSYGVDHGIGNPDVAALQADMKSVRLQFQNEFGNGVLNTISVSGVKDLAGNMLITATTFRYFFAQPANARDLVINEIFPDPSPQIGLPPAEFVEIYNRSAKAFDLAGWTWKDQTSTTTLSQHFILPGEYLILCSTAAANDYEPLGNTLGISNFPTLNNGEDALVLLTPEGVKIDSVSYSSSWYQDEDKAQGGFTLERLNPETESNEPTNWIASDHVTGGTPGAINTAFGKNPDSKAPLFHSLEVISDRQVKLFFDEPLEPGNAQDVSHYLIDNSFYPATAQATDTVIVLNFASPFVNGKNHILNISGVTDLAGNVLAPVAITFRHFVPSPATLGAVLINEIMADPTPVVQLPEAEYIEIVNVSTSPYSLKDWQLVDAAGITTLPDRIVMPGDFLVLTSTSNRNKFSEEINVQGVSNFPSLNNLGEVLTIKDSNGTLIDSLNFSERWYQDATKQEGGWSLERLLYNFASADETNWRASENISGGTPGIVNSVFGKNPDSMPAQLLHLDVVSESILKLAFNEPIDTSGVIDATFEVNNSIGNPFGIEWDSDGKLVTLHFATPFTNGLDYVLTLREIRDLAGNVHPTHQESFRYFVPVAASPKDIIITEIMADPSPIVDLPEAEYFEVYNRSSHPFDFKGWLITDGKDSASLPSQIILPHTYWVLTSSAQAAKFSGFGNTLGVSNFPALNNEGESLWLVAPGGTMIDSVNFDRNWYRNSEKSEGGWSLELIDLNNLCGEENNWVASESDRGGSPGYLNSVDANKPDLVGPRLLSVTTTAPTELLLQFDEKLERTLDHSGFEIFPEVPVAAVKFTDTSLRTVLIQMWQALAPRTWYTINLVNVYDCAGNPLQGETGTQRFALPEQAEPGDVLINEILFNPLPGGSDFIELYNRSEKFLNLNGWMFAQIDSETLMNHESLMDRPYMVPPHTFLAFAASREKILEAFPRAPEAHVLEAQLPSLPDDEGSVVLLRDDSVLLDHLQYQSSYHSPFIKQDEGISLERISYDLDTNDPSNWTSATGLVGFGTPGAINSNQRPAALVQAGEVLITPEIFSPVSDQGFAQIQFKFQSAGSVANVKIFDLHGHTIREIANNEPIGFEGSFQWHGDRADSTLADNGYYVVWFEVFDLDGNVSTYRKRIVIADR